MLNPSPIEPPPESGAASWRAQECPFRIDYSTAVVERIRERAVQAFHQLPGGGLEIGGVLFGRVYPNARTPLRVEVIAERALECGHAQGPIFTLTEEEKAQAAALLDRARVDPELSALSVTGFWVSHSRSGVGLTPDDLDLYRKLFPNPWQVALILKPESGAPVQASFFFRAGGEVAVHQPQHRFFLESGGARTEEHDAPIGLQPETQSAPERGMPAARTARRMVGMPALALLMFLSALVGAGLTYWLLVMERAR